MVYAEIILFVQAGRAAQCNQGLDVEHTVSWAAYVQILSQAKMEKESQPVSMLWLCVSI